MLVRVLAIGDGSQAGRIVSDKGVGIVVLAESEHALSEALHVLVSRSARAFCANRERIELSASSLSDLGILYMP